MFEKVIVKKIEETFIRIFLNDKAELSRKEERINGSRRKPDKARRKTEEVNGLNGKDSYKRSTFALQYFKRRFQLLNYKKGLKN